MSVGSIYRLDKLIFPSSVEFSVLKDARWTAGIESLIENPSGAVFPMFRANARQKPMINFTTPQLDVLLANIGAGGASFGTITSYFKKGSNTGNVARATTVHQKIAVSSSVAYWTEIRLVDKGTSEGKVVICPQWDGTNDPFAYTGSIALSGSLIGGNWFGLGPVAVNGVTIPGVQEVTITSDVRLVQLGSDGEEFDTFCGVEQVRPTITIKTYTMTNWATLGLRGLALDGTNGVICYGRKYANYGSRVSNATGAHLSFQGLYGTATPVDTSGNGNSPLSDTLKVELVASAAETSPLTISTTSTIGISP